MINLSKKQLCIMGGIALGIILIIGYYIYTISSNQPNYEELETIGETVNNQIQEEQEEIIVVHIAGEINKPGIVRIKEGARIADIIEKAEGLTQEADITNINLAYIVEDGQKIIIPNKQDKKEQDSEYIQTESGDTNLQDTLKQQEKGEKLSMININKASQKELEQLPGIGPSTALKIIEYRKENGNFNSVEDIKNVPGIGDAKFDNIKDNISVK